MSECGICGRPEWDGVSANMKEPECGRSVGGAWSPNYAKDCYRLGYARLESELREARECLRLAVEDADRARSYGKFTTAEATVALSAERTARRVMREALEWLVRLKEGPRDDKYRSDKPKAWAAARAALAAEPGEGPATPGARSKAAMLAGACHGCGGVRDWILNGHVQAFCWRCEGAFHGVRCARLAPPEGHPRAAEVKNEG